MQRTIAMPLINNLLKGFKKEINKRLHPTLPGPKRQSINNRPSYRNAVNNARSQQSQTSTAPKPTADSTAHTTFKPQTPAPTTDDIKTDQKVVDDQIAAEELIMPATQDNDLALNNDEADLESVPPQNPAVTRKNGTIHIKVAYHDENGNPLAPTITLSGEYQAPLNIPWRTFPGYVLAQTINYQQVFFPNSDGITLIYSRQQAAPVVVYHRDINGNLLVPPEYIEGDLNSRYQVEPLEIYKDTLVKEPDDLSGEFSTDSKLLSFTYEPQRIEYNKLEKEMFVRIHRAIRPSLAPRSDQKLNIVLPIGSVWKVFQLAYDPQTDNIWLDLGGSEWVMNDNDAIESMNNNPNILPADVPLGLPQIRYTITEEADIDQEALIDMDPQNRIVIWATPYGDIQPTGLPGQTKVTVVKNMTLENNSHWSQLADGFWVETSYLRFI